MLNDLYQYYKKKTIHNFEQNSLFKKEDFSTYQTTNTLVQHSKTNLKSMLLNLLFFISFFFTFMALLKYLTPAGTNLDAPNYFSIKIMILSSVHLMFFYIAEWNRKKDHSDSFSLWRTTLGFSSLVYLYNYVWRFGFSSFWPAFSSTIFLIILFLASYFWGGVWTNWSKTHKISKFISYPINCFLNSFSNLNQIGMVLFYKFCKDREEMRREIYNYHQAQEEGQANTHQRTREVQDYIDDAHNGVFRIPPHLGMVVQTIRANHPPPPEPAVVLKMFNDLPLSPLKRFVHKRLIDAQGNENQFLVFMFLTLPPSLSLDGKKMILQSCVMVPPTHVIDLKEEDISEESLKTFWGPLTENQIKNLLTVSFNPIDYVTAWKNFKVHKRLPNFDGTTMAAFSRTGIRELLSGDLEKLVKLTEEGESYKVLKTKNDYIVAKKHFLNCVEGYFESTKTDIICFYKNEQPVACVAVNKNLEIEEIKSPQNKPVEPEVRHVVERDLLLLSEERNKKVS